MKSRTQAMIWSGGISDARSAGRECSTWPAARTAPRTDPCPRPEQLYVAANERLTSGLLSVAYEIDHFASPSRQISLRAGGRMQQLIGSMASHIAQIRVADYPCGRA